MGNRVAALILQQAVRKLAAVFRGKAQIVFHIQLGVPGVGIEDHQVLGVRVRGGNLPGNLFRREVDGLIRHFQARPVRMPRHIILLRHRRPRQAVVELHQQHFLPGCREVRRGYLDPASTDPRTAIFSPVASAASVARLFFLTSASAV